MVQYAMNKKTIDEAVRGGGVLVVAQWEAKDGQLTRLPTFCGVFCRRPRAIPAQSYSWSVEERRIPDNFYSMNFSAMKPL